MRALELSSILIGLGLLFYGLWSIYPPAASIVAGLLFIGAGVPGKAAR